MSNRSEICLYSKPGLMLKDNGTTLLFTFEVISNPIQVVTSKYDRLRNAQVFGNTADLHVAFRKQYAVIQPLLLTLQRWTESETQALICDTLHTNMESGHPNICVFWKSTYNCS